MTIIKEINDNELCLFLDDVLFYKIGFNTGQSIILDIVAYDKYIKNLRQLNYKNPRGYISLKALLKLKATESGGRLNGI